MLITDGDDRAVLGRQGRWPKGWFSTLAGFVEPGESLPDAVRREVMEEAGLVVGSVEFAGSQPWPFPSSLMLGFHGIAETEDIVVDGDELAEARWFSRDEVTELTAAGELLLPPSVSISRWLIDTWHQGEITGNWARS
jgi:NAD+ diphosphatase